MSYVMCKVHLHSKVGPCTHLAEEVEESTLADSLAEVLAGIDRQVVDALANGPLLVDAVIVEFSFGFAIRRTLLSTSWISAASAVAGLLNLVAERDGKTRADLEVKPHTSSQASEAGDVFIAGNGTPGGQEEGRPSNG